MIDKYGQQVNIGDDVVIAVSNTLYKGKVVAMNAHVTIETPAYGSTVRKSAAPNRVIKLNNEYTKGM